MERQFGSLWGRWDLHVHTPGTNKNDQFEGHSLDEKWENFYQAVNAYVGDGSDLSKRIVAIGITDYLSIDNYNKVVQDRRLPSCVEFILPNVELRLSTRSGDSPINIHAIFDPEIAPNLQDHFFSKLHYKYMGTEYSATRSSLTEFGKRQNNQLSGDAAYRNGVEHFTVDLSELEGVFEADSYLRQHTIIAIPNSSTDGASGLSGQLETVKRQLYYLSDCIFSSNAGDRAYFLGKKADTPEQIISQYRSLKPCIHGSDAHSLAKLFEPDLKRYCWIKAEPTFAGLQQILYEPEARVCIQDSIPEARDSHQIIESLQINDPEFQAQPIYFNEALTCIIGGKSTGKSLLLHTLAKTIDSEYAAEQSKLGAMRGKAKEIKSAVVTWKDGTTASRKIVYIPQAFLNYTIDDPEHPSAIDDIIADVLFQNPTIAAAKATWEESVRDIKNNVRTNIVTLLDLEEQLKRAELTIKQQGHSSTFRESITRLEKKREELAKTVSISEEEIERFTKLEKELQALSEKKDAYIAEHQQLELLPMPEAVIPGFFSINAANEIAHSIKEFFPISSTPLQEALSAATQAMVPAWLETIAQAKAKLETLIGEIKVEREKLFVEYTLLKEKVSKSEQLKSLTQQISNDRKLLEEAATREQNRETIIRQIHATIDALLNSQAAFYEAYKDFQNAIQDLSSQQNTSLRFGAEVIWKRTEFQSALVAIFDNRYFAPFRTHTSYDLFDLKDDAYDKGLLSTIWKAMNGEDSRCPLFVKSSFSREDAITRLFDDWYNMHYLVESGADTIDRMSPGKKALVLLELLISLEDSKCPILIDQPEDDLDNRSIYNDLVRFIRTKKKERQIIVVTHNANVVVGADAEEVIIANQDGTDTENAERRFEYRSGAIENDSPKKDDRGRLCPGILNKSGIQTHICEILEGGREAFKLRKSKYSTLD